MSNDVNEVKKVSKSQQIRLLTKQGLTRKQISKKMGIRYQFVYNVQKSSGLIQPKPKEEDEVVETS